MSGIEHQPCHDCGIPTTPPVEAPAPGVRRWPTGLRGWEWYMVHADVWVAAGLGSDDGFLCVGCLERRLGRRISAGDLTDAPINRPCPEDTPRMAARKANFST